MQKRLTKMPTGVYVRVDTASDRRVCAHMCVCVVIKGMEKCGGLHILSRIRRPHACITIPTPP